VAPAPGALRALLAAEDTDHDQRITIVDQGRGAFALPLQDGTELRVAGTYELASLVQELYLMEQGGRATLACDHLLEDVPDRLHRLIREQFWSGLTRRLDAASLDQVLSDPKMASQERAGSALWPSECSAPPKQGVPQFLYVPHHDARALEYYDALRDEHPQLVVCQLPNPITPQWVQSLDANVEHGSRHGLLTLALAGEAKQLQAVPYVVPGGRFNELYGWDSYFHVLGLLQDGHAALARAVVDNQLYEVEHYGQVLNANRTYYLTRSQPPLLSSAVREIWERARTPLKIDELWLKRALQLLTKDYQTVWAGARRRSPLCARVAPSGQGASNSDRVCLSTYHAEGMGEPPEVEPGHFDWLYQSRAGVWDQDAQQLRAAYRARSLPASQLQDLDRFFLHDRSMRESGHDTTYRWTVPITEHGRTMWQDRCADFATVDLNALLFKMELDLATLSAELAEPDAQMWCERARTRKALVQKYLFNGELFVDYQMMLNAQGELLAEGTQSKVVSATTFYPLWASVPSPCTDEQGLPLSLLADQAQAQGVVLHALPLLEAAGGLMATERRSTFEGSEWTPRQWDAPFGWAPHQILAWSGLRRWGMDDVAERLSYKWLYMIAKNAHDFHGTVPEKYDVVRRSHHVFAEYGNVGTDFAYITQEGFGWMNASFQIGWASLPDARRADLRALRERP
jgi:alpha,alpha-trehalase